MWEWKNEDRAYRDELYHYGVLGMKWGIRRAQNYAFKAGKYYGKHLKIKNKINNLSQKYAKKAISSKFDKGTKTNVINVDMRKLDKFNKKCAKYQGISDRYISKVNSNNKKAVSIVNKYNIKNGADLINKKFDAGVIFGRMNNSYSNIGGIVGTAIGYKPTVKKLQKEGYKFY